MIAAQNAQLGLDAPQRLRKGDRIVQVNGRQPAHQSGFVGSSVDAIKVPGNVMPYMRLALAGDNNLLTLRLQRGPMPAPEVPTAASDAPPRAAPPRATPPRGAEGTGNHLSEDGPSSAGDASRGSAPGCAPSSAEPGC